MGVVLSDQRMGHDDEKWVSMVWQITSAWRVQWQVTSPERDTHVTGCHDVSSSHTDTCINYGRNFFSFHFFVLWNARAPVIFVTTNHLRRICLPVHCSDLWRMAQASLIGCLIQSKLCPVAEKFLLERQTSSHVLFHVQNILLWRQNDHTCGKSRPF